MSTPLFDRIAALFGVAKALELIRRMDGPLVRQTGQHHCGPVGRSSAHHVNHSQRSRANRRSAKRAARIHRRGAQG